MLNPIHNHLDVFICKDAADASAQGFNYNASSSPASAIKPIQVSKVVVVRNGTVEGNPTVDFLLVDESGQQYVFMVTGRLLKSIPC
jgi:hypothetical protein